MTAARGRLAGPTGTPRPRAESLSLAWTCRAIPLREMNPGGVAMKDQFAAPDEPLLAV